MKSLFTRAKSWASARSKFLWTNHRKKTIAGIFLVIIIILLSSGGSADVSADHSVTKHSVIDQVVLSGRTESVSSVDLGFADSGRVDRVYVVEGQKVAKGQTLAQLEMGDLAAQLQSARAGLTIALANINQTGTNVDRITREQNAIVETAKRNLYGDLEAYPENAYSTYEAPTIYGSYQGDETGEYKLHIYSSAASTGASIEYTGLESGITALTVENRVALGTRGLFIQFPDSDGYANSEWVIPIPNDRSSEYPALKNAYETAIATRERTISAAKSDIAGDAGSVLQAKADQARASVNQILSAMERRRITAPFSGTISAVGLKEGESTIGISKDTSPGVSMLATDQYKVVIKIPEIDVARVAPNTPVTVTLDAYGQDKPFKGILSTINPAETIVDGVPVYEGTVLFDEYSDEVRSGMTSTVTIVIGEKADVLAIPGNYISEDKVTRKFYVNVLSEGKKKPEKREVTTGIRGSDGMTEIISGLSGGEIIVLTTK